MEPAEARAVLELTLDASSEDVRRAYLRKVREHGPERDPEGFRRVREAYELLRNVALLPEMVAASGEPLPVDWLEPACEPGMAGAEPIHGFRAQSFVERLRQLPDGFAVAEAVAIWAEALESVPGWDLEIEELLEPLRTAQRTDAMLACLRLGAQRDDEACWSQLLQSFGDELTDDELAAASSRPLARWQRLRVLAHRRPDHLAREAADLLEGAREGAYVDYALLFRVVLELYARGRDEDGKRLVVALRRRIEEAGGELKLFDVEATLSSMAVSEALKVRPRIPDAVWRHVAAVAAGLAARQRTRVAFVRSRWRYPSDPRTAADILYREAPALYRRVCHEIGFSDEEQGRLTISCGVMMLVLAVVLALRFIAL